MIARRAFLGGLARLPLVGGAVGIIGAPTAVAEPVSDQLLFEYGQWLSWERVAAHRALYGRGYGTDGAADSLEYHAAYSVAQFLHGASVPLELSEAAADRKLRSHAYRWHHGAPSASTRAALIMATVGCDWRRPYR